LEAEILTQTEGSQFYFSRLSSFVTEAMSGMLHPELENSSPAYALASDIHRDQHSITRFRLYLATDAILSSRVKDLPGKIS